MRGEISLKALLRVRCRAYQTLFPGGPWSSWPSPILGRDRFGRISCIHRTRANVFLHPSCPSCVLVAVVDRAGRGGTRKVKAAFEAVETRYAELGHTLQRPVSGEIVAIPIMGASKSLKDRHTLYVSSRAVESGLVDGLIAHEVGHMLRTEARHPSHSPDVYRLIAKEVRIPRAAEAAFGQAFNHVQDVYADDLAFPVFAGADGRRAYDFYAKLPESPSPDQFIAELKRLAAIMTKASTT